MNEDVKKTALSVASNPIEAGEKAVKSGVSKAGKLLKKAYHGVVGGKGKGDSKVSWGGPGNRTTVKNTNVDSPGEHLRMAYHQATMDPKGTAKKAAVGVAALGAGALAARALKKRRERRQHDYD
jgi:hypothetical protein